MGKIDIFFGLVLLASFSFYMEGWSYSLYEQVQLGLCIFSILVGGYLIMRRPRSIKRTVFVVLGLLIGNWGVIVNFAHAVYFEVFGFV